MIRWPKAGLRALHGAFPPDSGIDHKESEGPLAELVIEKYTFRLSGVQ